MEGTCASLWMGPGPTQLQGTKQRLLFLGHQWEVASLTQAQLQWELWVHIGGLVQWPTKDTSKSA